MSTRVREASGVDRTVTRPHRWLALLGVLALLSSFLRVLHHIVSVGGESPFWLLVAGSFLGATVLARYLRVVLAVAVAVVLLAGGLTWYVLSLPYEPHLLAMLASNLELATGKSLLQIEQAPTWALSVTPAPIFATWYLALRRWYTSAVTLGGLSLAYFVLTGDAGLTVTLIGVVGAAAALGFGDLDTRSGSGSSAEYVAVVLAVMVAAPLLISVVPGGGGAPLSIADDIGDESLEAGLMSVDGDLAVQGSIELSPKVRFTVSADEPRLWRVDAFGRYAGTSWHRTGGERSYDERLLREPPGRTETITQRFQVESALDVIPAAWRPVDASGPPLSSASVTSEAGLRPGASLSAGDTYRVVSEAPDMRPQALRTAGGDYPRKMMAYTQVPESTPDRVGQRTAEITAGASTAYDTAKRIEHWLEENREYSLEVDKPDGNVADAFLFEMDRGYCVYYATTMAVMLRTQGIPARMAVGYTPGQQVDDGEWVVRGYNSHAWVEVYFPDHGWIPFDPTPPEPRETAEQARLEQARAAESTDADTNDSRGETSVPDPSAATESTPPNFTTPDLSDLEGQTGGPPTAAPMNDPDATIRLPKLPPPDRLVLGAIVVVGAAAGLRRSGLGHRTWREVWLRYLPRRDPEHDVEAAFERLWYLLERRHRPRHSGETTRQYLDAIGAGPRVRRVAEARERLRYGDGVTAAEADEVVAVVDSMIEDR